MHRKSPLIRLSGPPHWWPQNCSAGLDERNLDQAVGHITEEAGGEARLLLSDSLGDNGLVVTGGNHADASVVKHADQTAVQRLVLHRHILEVDGGGHVPDLPVEDERGHELGLSVLDRRGEVLASEHVGCEEGAGNHEGGTSRLINGQLLEREEAAGGGYEAWEHLGVHHMHQGAREEQTDAGHGGCPSQIVGFVLSHVVLFD